MSAVQQKSAEPSGSEPSANRLRNIYLLFGALWRLVRGEDQRGLVRRLDREEAFFAYPPAVPRVDPRFTEYDVTGTVPPRADAN